MSNRGIKRISSQKLPLDGSALPGIRPQWQNLRRSKTELAAAEIEFEMPQKSHRWESNPQPPHYECGALPIKATAAIGFY